MKKFIMLSVLTIMTASFAQAASEPTCTINLYQEREALTLKKIDTTLNKIYQSSPKNSEYVVDNINGLFDFLNTFADLAPIGEDIEWLAKFCSKYYDEEVFGLRVSILLKKNGFKLNQ